MPKYKFSGIFGLQPGADPDEAWKTWREKHVAMGVAETRPDVRKYTINRVIRRLTDVKVEDVWGISEFWFDDLDSALRAVERLQRATPDGFETKRVMSVKRIILEEVEVPL